MVFENQGKSLIQHCERSELRYVYILSGQNILKNAKNAQLEACGQTVLPERSVFIRQKLVENAKIKKIKCDILSYFQTMSCYIMFLI